MLALGADAQPGPPAFTPKQGLRPLLLFQTQWFDHGTSHCTQRKFSSLFTPAAVFWPAAFTLLTAMLLAKIREANPIKQTAKAQRTCFMRN
jgi:hypothetical protein